jgi:hypothetical protein
MLSLGREDLPSGSTLLHGCSPNWVESCEGESEKRESESDGSLMSPGIQIALMSQLAFMAQSAIVRTRSDMCGSLDRPLLMTVTTAKQSQLKRMFFPLHS